MLVWPAAALALAGCSAGDSDPGPDGMTVGEARALDEAAEMLDERRPPDQTPPEADESASKAPPSRER